MKFVARWMKQFVRWLKSGKKVRPFRGNRRQCEGCRMDGDEEARRPLGAYDAGL